MILEMLKRSTLGIAFGAIATFIVLTIMKLNAWEASVSEIWLHMGASMFLGVYFGISSLIFGNSGNHLIKKSISHFILTYIACLIIAGMAGWIPISGWSVLWFSVIFILMYVLYWFGWYLYFKREEEALNKYLQSNKDE
ncbi:MULTISPECIES: DUF3021 domain-containing protein [Gracilibacillus]|uniref:DUF3021 domain-containing protein n=1 Tax=Gracilibacillus TaxID=74385 RepID=UPI000826C1C9|nr:MULTISPECIES: DUF3021 domain-containing protein [Gracilibacillus]